MKNTKHTKRRIRKTLMIARTIFLVASLTLIFFAAICDGSNLMMPLKFLATAIACFGTSYFIDYILDGKQSPFYH